MRPSGTKAWGRRAVLPDAERGALSIFEPTNTTVGASAVPTRQNPTPTNIASKQLRCAPSKSSACMKGGSPHVFVGSYFDLKSSEGWAALFRKNTQLLTSADNAESVPSRRFRAVGVRED